MSCASVNPMQRPGPTKRATLLDVAAHAGVSPKTVSNVVTGAFPVAERTRSRVEASLRALGYRPNVSARHLRYGRSGIVALTVPQVDDPYFGELARHLIAEAQKRSLAVILEQTGGTLAREREVLDGHLPLALDGILFSPSEVTAEDFERRSDTTPMVLLGEHTVAASVDRVAIDNVAAARAATAHLLARGCRRPAAIGVQSTRPNETSMERLAGYEQALKAAGLALDPDLVVPTRAFERELGAAALRQLLTLDEPPDGVFAFNDVLALGVLRAAYEEHVRIPEDLAVIGFDDIEEGRYAVPSLSTIAPDKRRIVHLALDRIAARLGGAAVEAIEVPFELRARESTRTRA
jgi:DNA-binding LacI/PurR family transcriptional regulator